MRVNAVGRAKGFLFACALAAPGVPRLGSQDLSNALLRASFLCTLTAERVQQALDGDPSSSLRAAHELADQANDWVHGSRPWLDDPVFFTCPDSDAPPLMRPFWDAGDDYVLPQAAAVGILADWQRYSWAATGMIRPLRFDPVVADSALSLWVPGGDDVWSSFAYAHATAAAL